MRLFSLCLFLICNKVQTGIISEEKCREYEDLSFKEIVCTSFLPIYIDGDSSCSRDPSCDTTIPLIVGGEAAEPHEFPHYALLGYDFGNPRLKFLCGGSLISEYFILTASHCHRAGSIEVSIVRLGESDLSPLKPKNSYVEDYEVQSFIPHPQYNAATYNNDIALIKLKLRAKLNNFVRPACLHQSNTEILKGKTALAIGFGTTQYGGDSSEQLLKVNLTVVQHSRCVNARGDGKIEKTQLCVKGEQATGGGFKDTCQGDSGGPLQFISVTNRCMFNIFGIVSNGRLCGYNIPAVYTRISAYIPWIESIVWQ